MRLGRQRWRTRGRIQSDDTQTWDEEEKVFLPHIHHHFEIKVTHTHYPQCTGTHTIPTMHMSLKASEGSVMSPSGGRGEGSGLAAGRHGNVCQCRLLGGRKSDDGGGGDGAGDHEAAAGGHLEVHTHARTRTHTHTHTHTHTLKYH